MQLTRAALRYVPVRQPIRVRAPEENATSRMDRRTEAGPAYSSARSCLCSRRWGRPVYQRRSRCTGFLGEILPSVKRHLERHKLPNDTTDGFTHLSVVAAKNPSPLSDALPPRGLTRNLRPGSHRRVRSDSTRAALLSVAAVILVSPLAALPAR